MKQQNTTNSGNMRHIIAIDAMIEGDTVTAAAARANMTRENLSRLLHHNPVFMAELNRRRADAQGEVRDGLRVLIARITAATLAALHDPETPPSVVLQAGLSALPKLYTLIKEMRDEAMDEQSIALTMIPDTLAVMLNEDENAAAERLVEVARREIEATSNL
jgi:hypothetical protein